MTSIISRFVAGRPAVKPQPRQQIANVADTVSRADFDKLAQVVNTMAKAIEGLIEDFDTVTSPDKLQQTVANAFKGITPPAGRVPLALKPLRADRGFMAPADDPVDMQVNKDSKGRAPLALPADSLSYLAPQGD